MQDNSTAIFATSNSSVNISYDNLIKNGSIGLKADYSSTITIHYCPIVGLDDTGDYACYANHNSTINATNNCWDSSQPTVYTANGGVVYWQPADSPCEGLSKSASSEEGSSSLSDGTNSSINDGFNDKELDLAFQYIIDKKYENAIAIYHTKFKEKNDLRMKRFILNQLAICYKKAEKHGFIEFLNKDVRTNLSTNNELYALTVELENIFLMKERNYDGVLNNLRILKSNFSDNDEIYKNAIFRILYLTYNYSKDTSTANSLLEELENKYPYDELTLNALLLLNKREEYRLAKQSIENQSNSNDLEIGNTIIPSKFALYENYPNPFNPITHIQYDLPENANVVLSVYDIQGQKIIDLVNSYKEAGSYDIIFDGSKFSSGTYFYKIVAGEFSKVKRMLLIK